MKKTMAVDRVDKQNIGADLLVPTEAILNAEEWK